MAVIEPQRERVAVIAGATGLIGAYCLEFLLESPRYEVVYAIGRRKPVQSHARLNAVETDFGNLSKLGLGHVDDVYCCIGTTLRRAGSREAFEAVDRDLPIKLAQGMRDFGASHFSMVSSLGADPNARSFYLRVKGETERAISAVGIRSLAFFRPSLLLGKRKDRRVGEEVGKVVMSALRPVLVGSLRRYRAIQPKAVALAMVLVAASVPFGTHVIESETIRKIVADNVGLTDT